MKLLIVTADDFGLHPAVNVAVEQAARAGVLTAASLMVGAPAAADAVRRARELPGLARRPAPRAGRRLVGVAARESIPALVDAQGRFGNNMVRDGVRFFALAAVRRQLEAEIRAQFQAFADTGLALDHVNAHKHFHLHPTLLEMLLRIGSEFGVAAVRLPREPAWAARRAGGPLAGPAVAGTPLPVARAHAAAAAGRAYRAQRPCLRHVGQRGDGRGADCSRSSPGFPRASPRSICIRRSSRAPRSRPSMSGYRHADELAALLSPRVRTAIAACAAATGGFRRLAPRPGTERRAA